MTSKQSNAHILITAPQKKAFSNLQFQRSPLAKMVAGVILLSSGFAHAADAPTPSVTELQAEIARLKEIIAKQNSAVPTTATTPATTSAVVQDTPKEQPKVEKKPVQLNTVTVRSRNRIERLQDVPLSVSVVTGKELERLQATDISAITQRVANVSWNLGNQRTSSLSIRGIGKQGQTEAQDPAVGLIVDGVNYAYNALASSYDFTDIETVEVTRGPQGTLLGKNTSIGVINVTTKRPSFKPDASYSVTLGEWDTVQGRFSAGGPVIDNLLAWRGNLSVSKGKGDITNAYNKDQTYTNKDRVSGRVQFLLTPTEDFNARFSFDAQPRAGETTNARTIYEPTPTTYADGSVNPLTSDNKTRLSRSWFTQDPNYTYDNNYLYGGGKNQVNNDTQRPLVTGSNGATAELNWSVAGHTLTSITAYKDYHFNAVNDEGTPFDVMRNSGGFFNDYKQTSQEFRITSLPGGFVDYQAGLYFMDVKNDAIYQRVWGNDAGAWFASNPQYATLNADGNGRYLLQNSLAGLSMAWNSPAGDQAIHNKSEAAFGQANWHFTDELTLTTGIRFTHENRRNTASSYIRDQGNAPELNPVDVNNVALGGFASTKFVAATKDANGNTVAAKGGDLESINSLAQLTLADNLAKKYFGAKITTVPGDAYKGLTAAQKAQVAAAKGLRQTQIGVVFNETDLEAYEKTLPAYVFSPSYKINENLTTYVSWQHGEKAGISQATNGISNLVKEEKTNAYEIGLKSLLLDNTLVFNIDVFQMDINDYQQTGRIQDIYTTNQNHLANPADNNIYYTNATINVPKVRAQGVEIDGIYSGFKNITLRFSGAYNDARYVKFTNSAQPTENGYASAPPYRDVSGETLPGASKYSFNIGADYRLPVFNNKEFHTSFNTLYASKYNSDVSLSSYSWIDAHSTTDLAIGIGSRNQTYDFSLIVKNAFDDDTPQSITWGANSFSYAPAVSRWFALNFTGKL